MLNGFIVKKIAMENMFLSDGRMIAVTRCSALPLKVTQIKTDEKDGYQAVQIAYGTRKRLDKPTSAKMKKLSLDIVPKGFMEFKATAEVPTVGSDILVDKVLTDGLTIDVTGISKGKGYAGVIKRHGFHRQPVSGGQSDRVRAPGAIGAQTPGKVVMGKKMPGHMGVVTKTIENLKVVKVLPEANQIVISGGIPGARNAWLVITPVTKHEN